MFVITQAGLAFAFGVMGNIISFLVTLSPLPTFYLIYKKKTAEGFQSIPYVISLYSGMLWILYALVKKDNALLLLTINSFCIVMAIFYIVIYLIYAPKKAKILTMKLLLLFIVFGFGAVVFVTLYILEGRTQVNFLGYFCMTFSLCVFVAPLGIVRKVIKTKSVEYMPFFLSFFLTLSAVMWFFYGLLLKDLNIAIPNVLGFIFGILQMTLYAIYKKGNKKTQDTIKLQELPEHIIVDVKKIGDTEKVTVVPALNIERCNDGNGVKIHVQNMKELDINITMNTLNEDATNKDEENKDVENGDVISEV